MDATLILPDEFPNSKNSPFILTSPSDGVYNCIAWAVESQTHFYWPSASPFFDWLCDLPRKANLTTFRQFFLKFGYLPCENGSPESGFQKIAIFVKGKTPSHAARQLPDGSWTSKIGAWVDVRHTLTAMEGGMYGDVAQFFRREVGL